jgi:hypothetical protein
MSEEESGSFGLTVSEKLVGFIILTMGSLFVYFSVTSFSVLGVIYTWFFGVLSLVLIIAGIFMLTAKTE